MAKIIYLGGLAELKHVQKFLNTHEVIFVENRQELANEILNAKYILDASMKIKLDADVLKRGKDLTAIFTATTGSDHIDKLYTSKYEISVKTLKDHKSFLSNITPAAEHSFLLLLAVARQLTRASSDVFNENWNRTDFPGYMLQGRTLGLIGCGRIGTWMSKYAKAFGMRVMGYDPYIAENNHSIDLVSLEDLLAGSDFVSLHLHLDEENKNFFDKTAFDLMKKGAVLINTSRGGLIDENELLKNLENGKLFGAGLDVLSSEPDISSNALIEYAKNNHNLIITPHIGGYSPDALLKVLEFVCSNIKKFELDE